MEKGFKFSMKFLLRMAFFPQKCMAMVLKHLYKGVVLGFDFSPASSKWINLFALTA